MPLAVGEQLGPYQILSLLGRGGMGEVYRARDTQLKREVALKILSPAFAADADRIARFQREAEVLASLNHPNIAHLYGLAESGGVRALVMELAEGETPQGPMPFEDAWKIAQQVAEGLEYAHERGVIHRDLKPANLKVTRDGRVKILDFGLAKALDGPARQTAASAGADSPTLTMGATPGSTQAGVVLGTAAYMAPEQIKGKDADRRADIWAFGVVLYELLTGERPFQGKDSTEIMARAVTAEPDLDKAPGNVQRLLSECLRKEPAERLGWIGDAGKLLTVESGFQPATDFSVGGHAGPKPGGSLKGRPHNTSRVPWAIVAALAVIAAGLGYVAFRHSQEEAPRVARFTVLPPEKGQFSTGPNPVVGPPAVSPDGRHIAFIANVDGKTGLWIRDLESPTPRLLGGTEGAVSPFWSPDSRYVGFGAGGKLKKIDVTGGPPVTLCDAPSLRGGAWNKNDVIVFTPANTPPSGLFRVSAAGGVPTPVTELDKSRNENSNRFPWFLPDGRHFLYMGRSTQREKTAVFVGDLESRERKQVVSGDTTAVYAEATGSSTGYLLFMRDQTLMAQPFDAGKLATTGEAHPVAEQVDHLGSLYGVFSVSQTGVLAYIAGGGGSGDEQITWIDRSGRPSGTVGPRSFIEWASLSPDGSTVAVDRRDPQTAVSDLWLRDLARGTESPFTFGGNARFPIWSPDGARIVFSATAKDGKEGMWVKSSNGTGQEEPLMDSPDRRPTDWSRDGRYIFAESTTGGIWVHPQFGDKKPYSYLPSQFREGEAKLSPDGKWLAYRSNESKHFEIYVVSFPTPEFKIQISTGGGRIPVWSRDGRELYFISADLKMMAVKVNAPGGKLQASVPQPLFDLRIGTDNPNFDVAKDGRFLIPTAVSEPENGLMTVVLNWQAGLKK